MTSEQNPRDGLVEALEGAPCNAIWHDESGERREYSIDDTTRAGYVSAEHLSRRREFELNGSTIYDRPLGSYTTPLYAHPPAPQDDARADGYREAFYELAAILNLPAQPISPREAWEGQMKPRILAACSDDARADVRGLVELENLRAFVEVIQWNSPNGGYVEVQYHPNGDWTVGGKVAQASDKARIEALEAENARLRVFVEHMARQQTIDEMDDDDRIDADWEGGFGYFVAEARTIVENFNVG